LFIVSTKHAESLALLSTDWFVYAAFMPLESMQNHLSNKKQH